MNLQTTFPAYPPQNRPFVKKKGARGQPPSQVNDGSESIVPLRLLDLETRNSQTQNQVDKLAKRVGELEAQLDDAKATNRMNKLIRHEDELEDRQDDKLIKRVDELEARLDNAEATNHMNQILNLGTIWEPPDSDGEDSTS